MKILDLATKIMKYSDCKIIIMKNMKQIKEPQNAKEFEGKIKNEIIENFTVNSFEIMNGDFIINVK